jgi:hypothetical protein
MSDLVWELTEKLSKAEKRIAELENELESAYDWKVENVAAYKKQPAEIAQATKELTGIVTYMVQHLHPDKADDFQPLDTLLGLVSQVDNVACQIPVVIAALREQVKQYEAECTGYDCCPLAPELRTLREQLARLGNGIDTTWAEEDERLIQIADDAYAAKIWDGEEMRHER